MKKSLTKIALHMDMLRSTFLACEILLVILRTICAVDAAVSAGISADLEKKMHVSFIIRFFQIHDPEVRTLSHSGVAFVITCQITAYTDSAQMRLTKKTKHPQPSGFHYFGTYQPKLAKNSGLKA